MSDLKSGPAMIHQQKGLRKPISIEMMGPAGAGKSSLIKILRESDQRFKLSSNPAGLNRIWYSAKLLGLLPGLILHRRTLSRDEIRSLVYLQAWHAMNVDDHEQITLYDHGPLYRIAVLREYGVKFAQAKHFQKWLNSWYDRWTQRLDLVVLLDAPNEILMERVIARGRFRVLMTVSSEEAMQQLDAYRRAFNRMLEPVRQTASFPQVLKFDTSTMTTEAIAAQVIEFVETLTGAQAIASQQVPAMEVT
jgi:deoxyadenosine/deoxycytidine kinase